jgi:hypothetical protein
VTNRALFRRHLASGSETGPPSTNQASVQIASRTWRVINSQPRIAWLCNDSLSLRKFRHHVGEEYRVRSAVTI